MKKTILSLALITIAALTHAASLKVDRIEPTDWFVGLDRAVPSLQLMVYGNDIRQAEVNINYPGVTVDSLVRLDSPNYLLVYINTRGAQPGQVPIQFKVGKKKTTVNFTLKQREMAGDKRMGFTNADVLYMLMPDRFADGNTGNNQVAGMRTYVTDRSKHSLRHGGDIEGLRQHLDYFNQLGVTALWFTPVLENDSPDNPFGYSTYHGYATTNYYRVDPRFGTNDEYRQLTDEAHRHGLKVVMDMIFNHCGFEHPWVNDMPANDWFNMPGWLKERKNINDSDPRGTSYMQTSYKLGPVLDPYASKIDLKETVEGWFVPTMPDLNQRNTHVMNYLIQNSIWWIETAGIDGIRMDTYPYAFDDAMAHWMEILDKEYPNFNVVGETWFEQPAYTAAWQKDSKIAPRDTYLKTVMDFSFYAMMDSAKIETTTGQWRGFNRVYNSLMLDYLYNDPNHVMAFLDNHDTNRFLENGKDARLLKQGLALLLTIKRIPQIYYGTEILMNGTKEQSDGYVRKDFPGGFPGDSRSAFTAEGRTEQENDMFNWLSALLHWRQGNKLVTEGKMTQFIPYNGVYVVARTLGNRALLTVVNGTEQMKPLSVARYAEIISGATTARDVPTGKTYDITRDIPLPPRAALILEFTQP